MAVVVSVVKADEPPGADALELAFDEVFDIPFQALGLLAVLLLYLGLYGGHLSFSCFFSRRDTDTNSLASSTSLLLYGSQRLLLNPPNKHCRR